MEDVTEPKNTTTSLAAQQRQAAETENANQEALRPDKAKLLAWSIELQNIEAPLITDIQLQSYRNSALERIHNTGEELADWVESFKG